MSFLDLKSIALLERALTSLNRLSTLHSFLEIAPTFPGSVLLPKQLNKWKWLQNCRCHIAEGIVCLEKMEAPMDVDLIDEITLYIKHRILPKQIEMLSIEAYEKCIKVEIHNVDQDSGIIVELFSRLKNMRTLIADGPMDTWIELILKFTDRIALESIVLYRLLTSQSLVIAIAKHCPNLKSLTVSRFADINASLRTLSEHQLPKDDLVISYVLSGLRLEHATHCTYALSRIRTLYLYSFPSNFHINILGLLSGIREVRAESDGGHILLPALTQLHLALQRFSLSSFSSASVEQVTDLIQSSCGDSGSSLTTLELTKRIPEQTNELVIALVPHCPHLQHLVLGTFWLKRTNISMDAILLALSWHCPHLRSLDIDMPYQVTELGLLQLIAACPQLLMLRVSMDSKISVLYGKLFQSYQRNTCWGTMKPHSTIAPWVAMRIAMLRLHCCQEAPQHPYTLDTLIRLLLSLF